MKIKILKIEKSDVSDRINNWFEIIIYLFDHLFSFSSTCNW